MTRVTSASAGKRSGGKKRGPLRSMSLEKAENGVVSTAQFEPAPGAKDEERYGPHLQSTMVHTKLNHLLKHVKEHTASFFPSAAPAADGSAPAAPAAPAAATPAAEPDDDETD